MITLWAKFKLWIVGIGAALLAFGAVMLRVYSTGKSSVKRKAADRTLRRVERAREIENETEALGDNHVVDELRDHGWLRDDGDKS